MAAAAVATVVMGALAATMRFDTSFVNLMDQALPEVRRFNEAIENFGEPANLVLVVEPPNAGTGKRFIAAAEKRLAELPEVIGLESRAPVEYLRRYGVWLLGDEETRALAGELEAVLPVLREGTRPLEALLRSSVSGLQSSEKRKDHHEDAKDTKKYKEKTKGSESSEPISEITRQIISAADDVARGRAAEAGMPPESSRLEELFESDGAYSTPGGGLMFLIVRTTMDPMQLSLGMPVYVSILRAVEEVKAEFPDVSAGFSGVYAMGYEDQTGVLGRVKVLSAVSLVLMMLIFYYYTRIPAAPFLLGASLVASIVWTFGLVKFAIGHISLTTALFGIFLFGLGVDFAIHIVMRYTEARGAGEDGAGAIRTALSRAGPGVTTGGLTTATAFAVLLLSEFKGGVHLGITTSMGLLCCLAAMLFVFPALISIWQERRAAIRPVAVERRARWLDGYVAAVTRRPGVTLTVCGAATLALLPFMKNFKIEYDLDRMIYRDVPALELKKKVESAFDMSTDFAVAFAGTVEEARERSRRLKGFSSVKKVESVADFIPEPTAERRRLAGLIREAAGYEPEFEPLDARSLGAMIDRLPAPTDENGGSAAASLTGYLREHRDDEGVLKRLRLFEKELAAAFVKTMGLLARAAPDEPPEIEDLPPEFRARLIARDGRFPLVIYPEKNILRREALLKFKRDVRSVCPEATGMMIVTELMTTAGMERLPWLCALIMALIFAIIYADFRSVRDTLLALLPVAAGCVWTVGMLCVLRPMLTLFIGISFPLVVGIGVDDGVHLMHRVRQEGGAPGAADAVRLTGRPIFMTTMTTMAGFGILLLTNHNGLIGMGATITLGVGLCFVTSVTLLPAVLALMAGEKIKR